MPPKDSSMLTDKVERVSFSYFDTQLVAAAAVPQQYDLFQLARGQAGNGFAAKTAIHTNMQANAMMPSGHKFVVRGVAVNVVNVVGAGPVVPSTNDALQLLELIDLSFVLVNKEKLSGPLSMFGGGNHPFDGAAAAAMPMNGWPTVSNFYPLGKSPIILSPQATFRVSLTLRQAPGVALSQPSWLRVFLHGVLYRYAQ